MSDPSTQIDELATLRQTVAELTAKNANRKARITELEAQLATANTATQTAQASLHEIEVTRPMLTLAEAVSPTPELFLTEFARVGYKVVMQDGKLRIMQGDQAIDAEVTVDGIRKLLLTEDAKHKNFKHLVSVSRASGGGAVSQSSHAGSLVPPSEQASKPSKLSFGLR